jgi:hypothetical protein
MKRLLFPAIVASASAAGLLALGACDPDLGIVKTPGEGGAAEAAATDGSVVQPASDAGPTTEGGPDDGGTEAGTVGHKVDGINDFAAGEKFDTTSTLIDPSYHAYVAWDAKNVFFGMEGNDISATVANAVNKWVIIYIGRDALPGSTTGLPYNGTVQQPTLPFSASINLRWKVSGEYTNVQRWNGATWEDTSAVSPAIPLTVFRQSKFVEMSVPRGSLGSPSRIQVVMNMLIENGSDFTYAGVPSTTFTDKIDPDFSKFFDFDLTDLAKAPNTYVPKP